MAIKKIICSSTFLSRRNSHLRASLLQFSSKARGGDHAGKELCSESGFSLPPTASTSAVFMVAGIGAKAQSCRQLIFLGKPRHQKKKTAVEGITRHSHELAVNALLNRLSVLPAHEIVVLKQLSNSPSQPPRLLRGKRVGLKKT
jgi:hypothetical protein